MPYRHYGKKMKTKNLNIIIVLGLIATVGILIAQLLWTKQAFNLEEKKFSQKTDSLFNLCSCGVRSLPL